MPASYFLELSRSQSQSAVGVGPRFFNAVTSNTVLNSQNHLVRSDFLSRKAAVRGLCFSKDPTGGCFFNIQFITAVHSIADRTNKWLAADGDTPGPLRVSNPYLMVGRLVEPLAVPCLYRSFVLLVGASAQFVHFQYPVSHPCSGQFLEAAPGPLRRMVDYTGPDHVHIDIPHTAPKMRSTFDHRCMIAVRPECSTTVLSSIVSLSKLTLHVLHEPGDRLIRASVCQQKMNVVGCYTIGKYANTLVNTKLLTQQRSVGIPFANRKRKSLL